MSKYCPTCAIASTRATYKPRSITSSREMTRSGKVYMRYHCVTCGRVWDTRDRVQWWPMSWSWSLATWAWGSRDMPTGYTAEGTRRVQRLMYIGALTLAFGRPPNAYVWRHTPTQEENAS